MVNLLRSTHKGKTFITFKPLKKSSPFLNKASVSKDFLARFAFLSIQN